MLLPNAGRHVCRSCLPLRAESSRMAALHTASPLLREKSAAHSQYKKAALDRHRERTVGTVWDPIRQRELDTFKRGATPHAGKARKGSSGPGEREREGRPNRNVAEGQRPALRLSVRQAALLLLEEMGKWEADAAVRHALQLFRLGDAQMRALLPAFKEAARKELEAMIKLDPAADSEQGRTWKMAFVADEMAKAGMHDAVRKAFMWRFLTWAPGHALAPGQAPAAGPLGRLLAIDTAFGRTAVLPRLMAQTRSLQRKIVLHVGPTNSGKTYHALKALVAAASGIYAGPLRLLAHEVWRRVNAGGYDGVPKRCNLVTGEEIRLVGEWSDFIACTVEMTSTSRRFEVAVIDEIQMIADPTRGGSWMNALLGVQADEVHLCGEDTVVDLITTIARECGDELVINRYERLTPLTIATQPLGDVAKVEPGDAIVSFSRTDIFALQGVIERKTGLHCALAYGALPAEVRNEQARVFNDPKSGCDVLVASDAIGMGLNLKIKRIIFHRMEKWDGNALLELSTNQVKQIAGRAGRYGMHAEGGVVTTLNAEDLPALRRAMSTANAPVLRGYVNIDSELLFAFCDQLPPGTPLREVQGVLQQFTRTAPWQAATFVSNAVNMPSVDGFNELPMRIQLNWIEAPWPRENAWPLVAACVRDFLTGFIEGTSAVALQPVLEAHGLYDPFAVIDMGRALIRDDSMGPAMRRLLSNAKTLQFLESAHRVITFYLWLSYRFPLRFGEQPEAFAMRKQVENATQIALAWIAKAPLVLREALDADTAADADADGDTAPEFILHEDVLLERWETAGARSAEKFLPISYDADGRAVWTSQAGETIPLQQRVEEASW